MGFLNPINLLWAAALGVLVFIYLRSRSRPTIAVSSLMLFDEVPAPVARMRHVRIDLLFWLEIAALTALVLAVAGLYVMAPVRAHHGRSHALVFDLGAAMSAKTSGTSSLEEAKRQAFGVIDDAAAGDEFSVITYALEAQVAAPQTRNIASVRKTIDALKPYAVPARASALEAAMMRARGASTIDLFTERPPSQRAIADAGTTAQVRVHRAAHGDDNVAIVSLDPGTLDASRGRVVLRNFSLKPRLAELQIKIADREVFHQTLMFAPREQMVVGFEPLKERGLISAQILTPDAIEADNRRWAYGQTDAAGRILVLSPDAAVREDLARVLIAVNPNLQIETADPAKFDSHANGARPFDLAVMHDCYFPGVPAASVLLIYPPAAIPPAARIPGLAVSAKAGPAVLNSARDRGDEAGQGAVVPAVRTLSLPDWMDTLALGTRPGTYDLAPIAAIGSVPGGRIGILAFDVRDRLLLDPDRLDALVITVNLMKRLMAPANLQIVSTGSYLNIPVTGPAAITAPGGAASTATPDQWGRVRLRPLESGRYTIESGNRTVQVFANYFDASESDLAMAASAPAARATGSAASSNSAGPREVQPLLIILAAMAMAAFVIEAAVLLRHASRWGLGHV